MPSRDPEVRRAYQNKWYAKNRERLKNRPQHKRNRAQARDHNYKVVYGITAAQVDQMRADQKDHCLICDSVMGEAYNVDHDHVTGEVRGILCRHCNLMLGYARDNPAILQRGINYLTRKQNGKS